MKKILEVTKYSDSDIRFKTDLDVHKNPQEIIDLVPQLTFSMLTSLWGGNETTVLSLIRTLAIADLGVSVNRKDMIRHLDRESKKVEQLVHEATRQMAKDGTGQMVYPRFTTVKS